MRNQEGLKLAWWEDLAHRSLGVGVVDVSDWKEKLQEGSGGTSWGLAGQGNQSEVWVEHWKRKKKLHTTPGMKSRCLKAVVPLLPDCHLMKPTNRSVLSLTMLVLTCQKQAYCCFEPGLPASLRRSAYGRLEYLSSVLDLCRHQSSARSRDLCFFYLQFQKSA